MEPILAAAAASLQWRRNIKTFGGGKLLLSPTQEWLTYLPKKDGKVP